MDWPTHIGSQRIKRWNLCNPYGDVGENTEASLNLMEEIMPGSFFLQGTIRSGELESGRKFEVNDVIGDESKRLVARVGYIEDARGCACLAEVQFIR